MSILDNEENYFAGTSGSGAFLGSDEDVSISPLFAGLDLNALGIDPNLFAEGLDLNTLLPDIIGDADVMNALKAQDPDAYAALLSAGEVGPNPADSGDPDKSYKTAETKKFERQTGGVPVGDPDDPMGTKKLADISGDKTSLPDKLKKLIADATGLGEDTIGELGKYGLLAGIAKLAYDDAEKARKAKLGYIAPGGSAKRAVISPGGSVSYTKAASGGIMSLAEGGMTSKQPFYLGGPTDGMADQIPAHIDNQRPAALSDGEFVIPADVVSHLGNGNSNAGAKRLYEMMDSIREARTGNSKQGKQINPNKFLPR